MAKSPRTAEPRGGRIDYDIDGRLVGSWFLEGTVDYSGGSTPTICGNRPCPYWTGHLSIAYDHIDPEQIRISIGADVGIGEEQCRECDSVYGVLGKKAKIKYVVTPPEIRSKYQYFTEAKTDRLRAAGYEKPFTSLEDGIAEYVGEFLNTGDPYR